MSEAALIDISEVVRRAQNIATSAQGTQKAPTRRILLSRQPSVKEPGTVSDITIEELVEEIRGTSNVKLIERIRAEPEKKRRNELKLGLPAVSISGSFSNFVKEVPLEVKFLRHSGLIQLDIDKDDMGDLDPQALRAEIQKDPHLVFLALSPSGGLKGAVRVDCDKETHAQGFEAMQQYFKSRYNVEVDTSVKDPQRRCYLTHDPEAYFNPDAETLPLPKVGTVQNEGGFRVHESPLRTFSTGAGISTGEIRSMLASIPPRPDYDQWIRIISAVLAAAGDPGTARTLLEEWSPEEQPGEYTEKLRHPLDQVGPGTLVHIARECGYEPGCYYGKPHTQGRVAGVAIPQGGASLKTRILQASFKPESEPELAAAIREAVCGGERGSGDLFAKAFAGEFRYDHTNKAWMTYSGGRWIEDTTQQVIPTMGRFVQAVFSRVAKRLQREMEADLESGKITPLELAKDPRQAEVKAAWAAHFALNRRQTLVNSLKFAGDRLPCLLTDFDAHPQLLNCRNGTLDLRSGELRPHSPGDLCRKMAAAQYIPEAPCPKWEAFMQVIFQEDGELVRYFQKLMGTGVCGLTDWDFVAFCLGNGANGKSTCFNILMQVLGDYATSFNIEMLLGGRDRRDQTSSYELCNLLGARFALASEIPDGRTFNESLLKDLSGGDRISARHPFGRPFEFTATHTMVVFGNHLPKINGTDHGIWSRLKLIPFNHRFPRAGEAGNRPRSEVEAELLEEREGILRWLVDGFRAARREGLKVPLAVGLATAEWREDADIFGAFIDGCCETANHRSCTTTTLHAAAREYCETNRQKCPSPAEMKRRLSAVGVTVKKVMGVRFYEGIDLKREG